jgi:ferredoxin
MAAAPIAEPEPVEEEDEGPQEPWIDSILCTSCNDCININSQMFLYNGAKQAMIGDPTAGTYRQLVEAAEKCPSRCIHPGTPLNPDEPGLGELKERAKKFN